jgi:hypothetical protein|nr:MAG TPA: Protein of unknown function (DUF3853) [Caudoviricetes sp.]
MANGIQRDLNTPLWQLTVGEFVELAKSLQDPGRGITDVTPRDGKKYVYGLNGLAELFACSKVTAFRIKKSGKINKAIKQIGRKIVIDADLALELTGKKYR